MATMIRVLLDGTLDCAQRKQQRPRGQHARALTGHHNVRAVGGVSPAFPTTTAAAGGAVGGAAAAVLGPVVLAAATAAVRGPATRRARRHRVPAAASAAVRTAAVPLVALVAAATAAAASTTARLRADANGTLSVEQAAGAGERGCDDGVDLSLELGHAVLATGCVLAGIQCLLTVAIQRVLFLLVRVVDVPRGGHGTRLPGCGRRRHHLLVLELEVAGLRVVHGVHVRVLSVGGLELVVHGVTLQHRLLLHGLLLHSHAWDVHQRDGVRLRQRQHDGRGQLLLIQLQHDLVVVLHLKIIIAIATIVHQRGCLNHRGSDVSCGARTEPRWVRLAVPRTKS